MKPYNITNLYSKAKKTNQTNTSTIVNLLLLLVAT